MIDKPLAKLNEKEKEKYKLLISGMDYHHKSYRL